MALGVVALAVALLLFSALIRSSGDGGPAIDGIPCESGESLEYHVHVHVAIFIDGQEIQVPAQTGIKDTCLYWLHTHDASGIVHVEAPSQRQFTLGQFFDIWGQPLTSTALLDHQVNPDHQVRAFVNGEEFLGDRSGITLSNLSVIVLEYGPPFPSPPPFQFPQGF